MTESPLPWIIALSPFWAYTSWRLLIHPVRRGRRLEWRVRPARAVVLAAFLGLLVVAFVRAGLGGAYSLTEAGGHALLWGTIFAFGAALFWAQDSYGEPDSRWRQALLGLALSLPIYVTLNVALHLLGLESPKTIYDAPLVQPARMLSAIGVQAARTLFPMAAGIAAFGMVAGAAFVSSFCLLVKSSQSMLRKGAYSITLIASGYAILATDTRAATLFVILTLAALLVIPKIMAKYAWALPVMSPLFPVALIAAITAMSGVLSESGLTRSEEDLATLNTRTVVWRAALGDLPSQGAKAVVGHGYEGHYLSGVSEEYAEWFVGYLEPEFRGLHNVYLQYVYDLGLMGVSLYLALMIVLMKTLSEWASSAPRGLGWPLLGFGVYLVFAGSIDRIPTPYAQELFLVFLMLVVWACSGPAEVPSAEGSQLPPQEEGVALAEPSEG